MSTEPTLPTLPTPRDLLDAFRRRTRDALELVSGVRHASYGLAVVRIGYGLVLLGHLVVNYGDRRLLWGPESPWTPDLLAETLAADGTFSLFALSSSGVFFELLYHAFVALVVLFVAGWRTRWITPLLVVMVWSWHQRHPWLLDGGDNLTQLVLIYLCFADLSARWSLDARRASKQAKGKAEGLAEPPVNRLGWRIGTVLHNGAVVATLLQVCIVYLNAGLLKVRGEFWQDGTAVYYTLRVEEFQPFPGLSRLIYDDALLVTAATYSAVFIQLAFPLLMLNTVTRRIGLVCAMGMHAGIGLLMALPAFSLIMIATDMLFVRDGTYRRLALLLRAAWKRWRRPAASDAGLRPDDVPRLAAPPVR